MAKAMGCLGFGALVLAGLLVAGMIAGRDEDGAPETVAATPADRYRADPGSAVTLTRARGTKGGFESVFLLSGALENAADFPIKDVSIACDLLAASGTRVGRVAATLYEIVPAGGSKTFRDLNMGFMGSDQVARFNCAATRAAPAD